jgi:hypothetical protein
LKKFKVKQKVTVVTRQIVNGKRKWLAADRKTEYTYLTPKYWLRWLPKGTSTYRYEPIGSVPLERATLLRAEKELALLKTPDAPLLLEQPQNLEQ